MGIVEDIAARKAAEARLNEAAKTSPESAGPTVEEQLRAARELEARLVPGVPSREPRGRMLDARDVEAKHPDKSIRWVNMRDPQKMESRQIDGYTRLTSEEGGRQLGNELVLMGIPKHLADAKIADQKQMNRERLEAHTRTMEQAVEGVARELRDRHGMSIDPRRLLVNEQ